MAWRAVQRRGARAEVLLPGVMALSFWQMADRVGALPI